MCLYAFSALFPHTGSKPWFCPFYYDRSHVTRAGWAVGAGWLEPYGCCHWTPPLLLPSKPWGALETRWPQHPPSPPPPQSCTHRGPRMHVNIQIAGTHMQRRRWLMHTQVNEKPSLTDFFFCSTCDCHISETCAGLKPHDPLYILAWFHILLVHGKENKRPTNVCCEA